MDTAIKQNSILKVFTPLRFCNRNAVNAVLLCSVGISPRPKKWKCSAARNLELVIADQNG